MAGSKRGRSVGQSEDEGRADKNETGLQGDSESYLKSDVDSDAGRRKRSKRRHSNLTNSLGMNDGNAPQGNHVAGSSVNAPQEYHGPQSLSRRGRIPFTALMAQIQTILNENGYPAFASTSPNSVLIFATTEDFGTVTATQGSVTAYNAAGYSRTVSSESGDRGRGFVRWMSDAIFGNSPDSISANGLNANTPVVLTQGQDAQGQEGGEGRPDGGGFVEDMSECEDGPE